MTESIPSLEITTLPNGNLRLEDRSYGDGAIVDVHPCQVRLLAERLSLVPTSDVQAARHIAALSRRLKVLHERIDRLSDYLLNHSDHSHADLSWELTYCTATLDIADEFVADLHDAPSDRNPIAPKSPEIGGVEEPQRRVASTGPQGELL
jgi:hypothetical protein